MFTSNYRQLYDDEEKFSISNEFFFMPILKNFHSTNKFFSATTNLHSMIYKHCKSAGGAPLSRMGKAIGLTKNLKILESYIK